MKEAFWGVLIVMLGLFGIVVVNLFQKVTIENDRVYYVIKETTEASMYDAVDLSTYRLTGKLRMVEDKFVENLTRRFAQNVSLGNYTITIQEINETPPYVSVVVKSSVTSIKGDAFTISNAVNSILETKYTLDELLEFLDITEDEWDNIQKSEDKNVCDMSNIGELECIPGDLKFGGFEDISVAESTCSDNPTIENKKANAKYFECECGKWVENEEEVEPISTTAGNSITYTYTFTKDGQYRSINETMTRKTKLDVCTTGVNVMVPSYLVDDKIPLPNNLEEPSKNNSAYKACPAEGIKIPSDQIIWLHGGYIPENATNRVLKWTRDGSAFSINSTNMYVSLASFSRAKVTAVNVPINIENPKTVNGNAKATTTNNISNTCKIEVWDGTVDSIKCEDMSLYINDSGVIKYSFTPRNANKIDKFTFTSDDETIAKITGNKVTILKNDKTTVTIIDNYTKKVYPKACTISGKVYQVSSGEAPYSDGNAIYEVRDVNNKIVYSGDDYEKAKSELNNCGSINGTSVMRATVNGETRVTEKVYKVGYNVTTTKYYGEQTNKPSYTEKVNNAPPANDDWNGNWGGIIQPLPNSPSCGSCPIFYP